MSSAHELISAIYAATLAPDDFNRKFDDLDSLLFGGEAEADLFAPLAGDAYPHIETARSIQERIGRARSPDQQIDSILRSIPNPSYLVTRRGAVVASNAMALARHAAKPTRLDDCVPDEDTRRQLSDFMSRDRSGKLLAVAGYSSPMRGGSQTSILLKRVESGLLPGETTPLFLLSIVDLGFDEETVELFRRTFELTESESRVAVLLATGLKLTDVASERQVSIDTVRTQVKTIKNKTGVRDIPSLVRLLCGLNAGALAPTTEGATRRSGPLRSRHRMTLSDGRTLEYVEQGASDGDVVLLFHNVPYGVDLPAAAVEEARRRGLRVIAPFRPGFAGSDAVEARIDDLITLVAHDMKELLDQLGIAHVVALSHSTGSPFALRFSRLHPQLVTRLVGVSRAPIWRDEWLAQMPQRQRFMLRLAKYAPQLLPVVAWAMVACMDSRYSHEFVAYNCKDGEADAKAAQDPEIAELIAKGSVEALRRSVEGVRRECDVMLCDFTEEARASPHKFHMLHGMDDRIIDPAQTLAFARAVPGTTVDTIEGAGQLLFFSHWRHMLDAVMPRRAVLAHRAA